ncbi:MAG: fructose-1,6-bisphosphatase [Leptospiraceae bacterium]|nr:MAG: fructose-1,6-bisphosphatase [Leptospiraceae bacterium]
MEKTSILHLHEIAPDFIKITDTVAREVYELSGKGKKFEADKLAVNIMEKLLNELPYKIRVLIGEGEKDNSAVLDQGKKYGMKLKENIELDVVVDPLECTTNFSKGLPDSMSVMLIARKDTIQPVPGTYMKQLLLPKEVKELGKPEILEQKKLSSEDKELINKYISIEEGDRKKIVINKQLLEAEPIEILKLVAIALDLNISDLTVVIQDRPRHKEIIDKVREAGAGIALIESGSISASAEIIVRKEGRYNLLMGTYGAPEGLIQAFMAKSTGSIFLGKIQPHNEKTEQEAEKFNLIDKIYSEEEWIKDEGILTMSGIHSSTWLPGVRKIYKKVKSSENTKPYRYLVSTVVWTINNVQLLELEDGDLRKKEILFQ